MSSDLSPIKTNLPLPDSDNRYRAVQDKLDKLAKSMNDATLNLTTLQRHMRTNAKRAEGLAVDIANAELDPLFIQLTNEVAHALGGAAVQVRALDRTASEVTDLAEQAKRTHARLYQALDDLRSSRPHRTPRPGFLTD